MDDVVGYTRCRCGDYFATDGHSRCEGCRRAVGREAVERVDVMVAGHVVSVGPKRRRERHRGTWRSSERTKAYHKARHRAAARLIALYPELYHAILAEELAMLGEAPVRPNRASANRRLLARAQPLDGDV